MPSLISQMRNGPQQLQPQLNNIDQVKSMMSAMRLSANPQQYLANMINSNPALVTLLKGGNLQSIATQMAKQRGIDINELIRELSAN